MAEFIFITYEGVKYRKVDRKAKVGELITYSYKGDYNDTPRLVTKVTHESAQFEPFYAESDDDETFGFAHYAYLVLEEISEPQPDVHALIANLGRRLHKVETQNAELASQNAQQAYEINELYRTVAELEAQL